MTTPTHTPIPDAPAGAVDPASSESRATVTDATAAQDASPQRTTRADRGTGTGLGLHERAIESALRLLKTDDSRIPTLDAIAADLAIDPALLQDRFADGHAVLLAAAEQSLLWLTERCTRAVVKIDADDAVGQCIALGTAFLQWTVDFQPHCRLIVERRLINIDERPALSRYLDAIYALMHKMLSRAQEMGHLHPNENIDMMVLSSRIFAFGLSQMVYSGRVQLSGVDPTGMATANDILADFVRRYSRGAQPGRQDAAPASTGHSDATAQASDGD